MKNLAFIGNSEPPAKLLEIFRKFTPGRAGVWKDLRGVDNYGEADYFAVIDYLPSELRGTVDESKCVFLGAHPETMQAYRNMDSYKGLKMYDCAHAFGFGEWWLKYDYDYLNALQPPTKSSCLGAVVSNADSQPYHKARLEWLKRFTSTPNLPFDLHGRIEPSTDAMKAYYRGACGSYDPRGSAVSGGNDHMSGKEDVYASHKYMIEFDATGKNYFSERVFDCLLMWAMPIYWGGESLGQYIPKESFVPLDINDNGQSVLSVIYTDLYERSLPAITEARQLLLNKYQIWARVHEAIFGA